jgi:hypothetical protein
MPNKKTFWLDFEKKSELIASQSPFLSIYFFPRTGFKALSLNVHAYIFTCTRVKTTKHFKAIHWPQVRYNAGLPDYS